MQTYTRCTLSTLEAEYDNEEHSSGTMSDGK